MRIAARCDAFLAAEEDAAKLEEADGFRAAAEVALERGEEAGDEGGTEDGLVFDERIADGDEGGAGARIPRRCVRR